MSSLIIQIRIFKAFGEFIVHSIVYDFSEKKIKEIVIVAADRQGIDD